MKRLATSLALAATLGAAASHSHAQVLDGPPIILNFSSYDIEAIKGSGRIPRPTGERPEEPLGNVPDRIARIAVNFRYIRASGVRGAIFRSSYVSKGTFKTDDSFRVWAASAAANDVLIGTYHFYSPSVDVRQQVAAYLANINDVCKSDPRVLRGRPILLVFDALPASGKSAVESLRGILAFAREVHARTGVWPGFYPENSLGESFRKGVPLLTESEKSDLRSCWLWVSRYSSAPPAPVGNLYFALWPGWQLWQYSAGEFWYEDGGVALLTRNPSTHEWDEAKYPTSWKPWEMPPEAFAQRRSIASNKVYPPFGYDHRRFPIGVPGSAIPLESNYFNGDAGGLADFWKAHSWVALE